MLDTCTTYIPQSSSSERCLICGELKWEHKNYKNEGF